MEENPQQLFSDQSMASLVLLLSELIRHENPDHLISLPAFSSKTTTATANPRNPSAAASTAKRDVKISSSTRSSDYEAEQMQDDLPRVCVDLVWA